MSVAGAVLKGLFKTGATFAGLQAGASLLDEYAEGNFSKPTQQLASVASFGMRYKSFQGVASGLLGTGRAGIGAFRQGRAAQMGFKLNRSSINYGIFAKTGLMQRAVDFMAPTSLMMGAGRLGIGAGKGVVKGLWNAGVGGLEYGRAGARVLGGSSAFAELGMMKHPEAPMVVAGLGLGVVKGVLGRRGLHRGPIQPAEPGFYEGPFYPVNAENFGAGITYGRSPVSSPEVMNGQAAVTRKMLKTRRL